MVVWWKIVAAGVVGGIAATAATSLYQATVAGAFGQALSEGGSDAKPANEQAADSASEAVTGAPVSPARKGAVGSLVHYATGVSLGVGYAALVARQPRAAAAFGVPFGLAVALILDDLLVPAFGWGAWPRDTPANTHAYGLTTHAVFGAVLDGGRRLTLAVVDQSSVPPAGGVGGGDVGFTDRR